LEVVKFSEVVFLALKVQNQVFGYLSPSRLFLTASPFYPLFTQPFGKHPLLPWLKTKQRAIPPVSLVLSRSCISERFGKIKWREEERLRNCPHGVSFSTVSAPPSKLAS